MKTQSLVFQADRVCANESGILDCAATYGLGVLVSYLGYELLAYLRCGVRVKFCLCLG